MKRLAKKPTIILSGIPFNLASALRPVKTCLEMLTGAAPGMAEIKGLPKTASQEEIINKLNEVIRRLNASGDDHAR